MEAARNGYHDEYRVMDALGMDVEFGPKSFDCVCAFGLVEHLCKMDSTDLLDKMEIVSRKVAILSTPNGYVPWTPTTGNPHQAHRCGWNVEEVVARGCTVLGTCG
jgi:hypothetical protein